MNETNFHFIYDGHPAPDPSPVSDAGPLLPSGLPIDACLEINLKIRETLTDSDDRATNMRAINELLDQRNEITKRPPIS